MPDYQNILVPTDFSAPSARAAKRANAIARAFGARLHVLHVVDYVPPRYVSVSLPQELSSPEGLVDRARAHLEQWVKDQGLEGTEIIVVAGSAKEKITAVAKKRGTDLIVIGASGERAMHLLLGSTTSGVLQDASCDVLAVHP